MLKWNPELQPWRWSPVPRVVRLLRGWLRSPLSLVRRRRTLIVSISSILYGYVFFLFYFFKKTQSELSDALLPPSSPTIQRPAWGTRTVRPREAETGASAADAHWTGGTRTCPPDSPLPWKGARACEGAREISGWWCTLLMYHVWWTIVRPLT